MNRAKLQQQRDWIQQRVNTGSTARGFSGFSAWDALELLDALLGEEAGVIRERVCVIDPCGATNGRFMFTQDGLTRIDPLANWSA